MKESLKKKKDFCTSLLRFYLIIQLQPKFWPSWKVPAAPEKYIWMFLVWELPGKHKQRDVDSWVRKNSSLFLFLSPASGIHCKTLAFTLCDKAWSPWRHKASWFIFFPMLFSLPATHRLNCHKLSPPQSISQPWGKGDPHTHILLPAIREASLTPRLTPSQPQNMYKDAWAKLVKISYTLYSPPPPGLYSYWHAFCVWVYALGTDSLFLQYSAETEQRITFCLCSEHHKGNTRKNTSDFIC